MASDKKTKTGKIKLGRPPKIGGRLDVTVQTILNKDDYKKLCELASSKNQSVASLIRAAVLDLLHRSDRRHT